MHKKPKSDKGQKLQWCFFNYLTFLDTNFVAQNVNQPSIEVMILFSSIS